MGVQDIFDAALDCHCDTLRECTSKDCVIEFDGQKWLVCITSASHSRNDIETDQHAVEEKMREFILYCDDLVRMGVKEIPEKARIFCQSKLEVEEYIVVRRLGAPHQRFHDRDGRCRRVTTELCDCHELSEWEGILDGAQE